MLRCIGRDNPGLFYVDFSRITIWESAPQTSVRAEFLFSDRQIAETEARLRQAVAAIASRFPLSQMDKYERELALHDCLAREISYDYGGVNSDNITVVGGLLHKKAVCEGYAKTFKLLCDRAGLSCVVVGGTATPKGEPGEGHAWNIVKLNGVCAHVDVTWDSTSRADDETCYDHFNITDDDIAQDHAWDRALLPPCASAENNWHVKNGYLAQSDAEFKSFIAAQLAAGQKSFSVKLGTRYPDQNAVAKVIDSALAGNFLGSFFFGGVLSYAMRYNPVRNIVSVVFR